MRRFSRSWVVAGVVLLGVLVAYGLSPQMTQAVLAVTLRQAIPLVLGALCGLMGERSGVINIGIEGQMLLAAFLAFMTVVWTDNLWLGVAVGVLVGVVMGLMLAFMAVTLKMDQIIAGTVLNILAIGLTGYYYQIGVSIKGKFTPIAIPVLSKIPLLGPVLFENPPLTYITLILVVVIHFVLFYTPWGLRSRAVGEHPRAADTLGINVFLVRYVNLLIGGALAGLAGAFLTLEAVGTFERLMTNGRGFVALAVMIFGRWNPIPAFLASLLFGFALALQTQLQAMAVVNIPHQFISMLPYILTILVLAGLRGRTRPPAADGIPYEKE